MGGYQEIRQKPCGQMLAKSGKRKSAAAGCGQNGRIAGCSQKHNDRMQAQEPEKTTAECKQNGRMRAQ